jgi:hypothetical protein
LPDKVLYYHFYRGLNKEAALHLDIASGGSFSHRIASEEKAILERILENTPYTGIFDELPEEEEIEPSPEHREETPSDQGEDITIASSQPFQSQDLAIHPEPSISQNLARVKEIPPLKDPFEPSIGDFGRTIKSHPYKSPPIDYNPDPFEEKSLSECPYKGHWEELKDGMSYDAIEGEQSYIEDNTIFSPSMPRQDDFFEPIYKPILSPNESIHAFFFETHDDPRNLPQQPKFRSHQDHLEDQQQWLESVKNLYATAIDWTDEILNIISLRDANPRDPLDNYNGLILEFEKEDNISENGSYFIYTSSSPSSHDQLPKSPSLSISTTHEIFNPLFLSPPIDFERVVVDAYIYNKYSRSHWHKS